MRNGLLDIKGIIFDFDFTLADSSKGVIKCINYALKKLGFKEMSDKKIKNTIGLTLEESLKNLIGNQDSDKIERFKSYFIAKADDVMADLTDLFTETSSVLKMLYDKRIKLGIVSTKFSYRIKNILKREDLLDLIEIIVGGEDVQEHKPNPEGLIEAIKKLKLTSSQILYVGDSVTDAETAFRAGVSFVAVLSGVTAQKDFKPYPVIQFIENVSEIPRLLSFL